MTVPTTYPGVYVQEFTPGGPIEGVGTSTAAFLGPSAAGPLNEPTLITSWDGFQSVFGDSPLDGSYLWYGVRGFFDNGGTACYVTRVSNAAYDEVVLNDMSSGTGSPTVRLRAREPGDLPSPIQVTVNDAAHAVAGAKVFNPTAQLQNASGTTVYVDDAAKALQFRAGDRITWSGLSDADVATVARVDGLAIHLTSPLPSTFTTATKLTLFDLQATDKTLRLTGGSSGQDASKLSAGSVIKLDQSATTANGVVARVDPERISASLTTYRVTLRAPLGTAFALTQDITVQSIEFGLTVKQGSTTRSYPVLSMDPAHSAYYGRAVNTDAAGLIIATPVEPPNTTAVPNNRPRTATVTLTGGSNDDPATLEPSDYKAALALLDPVRDINMVAVPGNTQGDTQFEVIDHCVRLRGRFAILDSWRGAPLFGSDGVQGQRDGLGTTHGEAALYFPWLLVAPAAGSTPILVPPSGHVAGVYARTDATRGVHKAPAGADALVNGALGVERTLSDVEHGQLNVDGINVVRVFSPGGRPIVWGARTTASNLSLRYVSTRRLLSFIELSIEDGIRWALFEPNNTKLWAKLRHSISEFLVRVWRDGGLFGTKASEAFYVRIDEVLNPDTERALGRLNLEIGVRPSYPAEFIILRIGIWAGGSDISEG
jgi:phage tail sheath protein FI